MMKTVYIPVHYGSGGDAILPEPLFGIKADSEKEARVILTWWARGRREKLYWDNAHLVPVVTVISSEEGSENNG
jgi:hypothetical protein